MADPLTDDELDLLQRWVRSVDWNDEQPNEWLGRVLAELRQARGDSGADWATVRSYKRERDEARAQVERLQAAWDELMQIAGVDEAIRPELRADTLAGYLQRTLGRASQALRDNREAHAEIHRMQAMATVGEIYVAMHRPEAAWSEVRELRETLGEASKIAQGFPPRAPAASAPAAPAMADNETAERIAAWLDSESDDAPGFAAELLSVAARKVRAGAWRTP